MKQARRRIQAPKVAAGEAWRHCAALRDSVFGRFPSADRWANEFRPVGLGSDPRHSSIPRETTIAKKRTIAEKQPEHRTDKNCQKIKKGRDLSIPALSWLVARIKPAYSRLPQLG